MKLYYAPSACSLAPHIALREAGEPFEAVKTDIRAKKLEDGSDYFAINPKGGVPALQLDTGDVLTENAAILTYIADQAPAGDLMPVSGLGRYRVLEWLTYVSSELHKGFGPLWNPASDDAAKDETRDLLGKKFGFVQDRIADGHYLTGENFTAADAYLFTILNWTGIHGIDLGKWPGLKAYQERVSARPAVQEAMKAEGLTQ